MITRRKLLIALGAGAFTAPLSSPAQPPAKMRRIGFLGTGTAAGMASWVEALRAGLRELGYVEGRNLAIEFRWADGNYERAPQLAAELVRLNVEVLVTHGTPGTRAAKGATATIPIVMAIAGDAMLVGLVASLARPGGNITGSTFFNPELAAKRLELLRETLPRITRIAALVNPDNPGMGPVRSAMEPTAQALKLDLQLFDVRGPADFESAFAAMTARRIGGIVIVEDGMINANTAAIAALAAKARLPAIGLTELAQAGGLMAYGVNYPDVYRHAAVFVDKILKGAKPGDLPIERATTFELVINSKAAKALGVTIPQSVLVRADKVIE